MMPGKTERVFALIAVLKQPENQDLLDAVRAVGYDDHADKGFMFGGFRFVDSHSMLTQGQTARFDALMVRLFNDYPQWSGGFFGAYMTAVQAQLRAEE